jgi:telomere length regulation protein
MEELLTPVSTAYKAAHLESGDTLIEALDPPKADSIPSQVSTPEEALKVLRTDPDLTTLKSALRYLVYDAHSNSGFRITYPSPIAAQLVNALVSHVLPNYWSIFNEALSDRNKKSFKYAQERELFLSCLRSVLGLNAILSRLKNLTQQIKGSEKKDKGLTSTETLSDLIDVLEALLSGERLIASIWSSLDGNSTQRRALWHEIVVLIGGGRILNGVAEYSSLINETSSQIVETMWAGDGVKYSQWLARNIVWWSKDLPKTPQGPWKQLSELLSKSLHLGFPGRPTWINFLFHLLMFSLDAVLYEILGLLQGTDEERSLFGFIIESLPIYEQRVVITSTLKFLSSRYVSQNTAMDVPNWWEADSGIISAAAGYLSYVIAGQDSRKEQLITWLTSLSGAGVGDAIGIRRVAVTIFSGSKYDVEIIVEKSLRNFGDELYIRHTPSLQQEGRPSFNEFHAINID